MLKHASAGVAAVLRPTAVQLNTMGSYESGIMGKSPAEIVAYPAASRRILTVNAQSGGINILEASDHTSPNEVSGFPAFDGLDADLTRPFAPSAQETPHKPSLDFERLLSHHQPPPLVPLCQRFSPVT